ncbi:hypothetical protein V6N11_047951 [Hibiscus sabdariffa]|uniref:Uncharacterized protein n=1 Tax=Hibiscus sabdariffa TaxID=183260 RepID=A0ABR2NXV4_9ROSI
MDDATDQFLKDFQNDLKVIQERGNDGFDQKCCEESDESSLTADFAEQKGQVSTREASIFVGLSDLTGNLLWQSQTESWISEEWESQMFDQMHERNGEDTNVLVTYSVKTKKQFETCSIEATESDGFDEQKQQQQLVTSSIESNVFDKLSVITNVDSVDFDDSISGLLEVPQSEGCDILNRGLLDSLMMTRGMSFAGTNVVTGEWVNNYKPCRFLVPSFDPGGSNTTVNFGHDVINTGSNFQNLHSYTMLEIAEIIVKLSRLSLSRTRNIDMDAYMRSQI